jgi:puromycin-sensitive aminopeptidase
MNSAERTATEDLNEDHRLPRTVWPRHYALQLTPDLEQHTFTGSTSISVEVTEPVRSILIHAVDLEVSSASVVVNGETVAAGIKPFGGVEMIELTFDDAVPAGEAELRFTFTGELNDQLRGFYRSTMTIGEGEDRSDHTIAVTQFEATHARRAFPCFDEPEFKATFGVTLDVPEGLMAVSNAAEVTRETSGGRTRITFADTVRMSTYLVAFVVGPLEATEPRLISGGDGTVALRIVHPPGMGHLTAFALGVAEAAIGFFEEYYAIPYPGDKIDLVAVPDFAFGAMENLGCITFREVLLLIDPERATKAELQRAADVINHELAHMWFGDLVTMTWWNGIWLNEAFATFMEVSASDAFRPEWDVWTNFGLARAAAFDTDALHSTRPIEYPVETAADSEGMFDILTYEKGCSVVRMLEQYLGAETFRNGIRDYLRDNAWGNTETTDLWDSLEAASGEPVRRIMDSWIFQGGHPQILAGRDGDRLHLDQRRAVLTASGAEAGESDEPRAWSVPLVIDAHLSDGTRDTLNVLLEEPTSIDLPSGTGAIQTNAGGNGFYRSSAPQAERLLLAGSDLPPLERFVLLDDAAFGLLSGEMTAGELRELVETVAARESNPPIWQRIASIAAQLVRLTRGEERERNRDWAVDLALANRSRFPEGRAASGDEAEVISHLLHLSAVTADDTRAQDVARSLLGENLRPADGVDPTLAAGAFAAVAACATPAEHALIVSTWRNPSDPQEEQRALSGLVATGDPDLFMDSVALAMNDVRAQDAPYMLRQALVNLDLGPLAWDAIEENWEHYATRFPTSALPRMLSGVRGFTDRQLASRVRVFLARHPLETGQQQVDQHLEWMDASVDAAERLSS